DRNETLVLERNATLKVTQRPDESSEEFHARLERTAEDRADEEMAKLRDRYETRFRKAKRAFDDAVRSADSAAAELDADRNEAMLGMGLDLLMGRKPKRSSSRSASNRLRRAEDKVERARAAHEDLAADLEDELTAIEDEWAEAVADVDTIEVGLESDDIRVTDVRLVWVRTSVL
nr:hypothetical protein [Acidimicrobiia bacterium]